VSAVLRVARSGELDVHIKNDVRSIVLEELMIPRRELGLDGKVSAYGIPVAAASSKEYVPSGTFQIMSENALAYSAKAPRPLVSSTGHREVGEGQFSEWDDEVPKVGTHFRRRTRQRHLLS
jgi:hypothetical protein